MSQWDVLIVIHLSSCLCQSVPVHFFTDCVSTWCCPLKQIISWLQGLGGRGVGGILRDPNSEVFSPPILAFPLSSSSVCLWARWKERLGVKWASGAKRDLGRVKGFLCSGRSETEADSTREDYQHLLISFSLFWPFACLHFLPLFVFLHLVSLSAFLESQFLLLTSNYFPFFSHYQNFSCVDFSHCPLFQSLIGPLSFPHFHVSHAGGFSLRAAPSLYTHMPCVTDVLTHTKGCSPGLDASQVSPSLLLDPWRFQIHKWQNPPFFWKSLRVTMGAATNGLGPLLWG